MGAESKTPFDYGKDECVRARMAAKLADAFEERFRYQPQGEVMCCVN
jgi:hypothetical protein